MVDVGVDVHFVGCRQDFLCLIMQGAPSFEGSANPTTLFAMVALRIPFTLPFPPPAIHPPNASTLATAISAVSAFLESRPTILLTGAGISVESGLADYRGEKGTYRVNRNYRPTFYAEFAGSHEARKRYELASWLVGWLGDSHFLRMHD